MVIRPEELEKLTPKEERVFHEVELEIDKELAERRYTVYLDNHFDSIQLTQRIQEEVKKRYSEVGWTVRWDEDCDRDGWWCHVTFSA